MTAALETLEVEEVMEAVTAHLATVPALLAAPLSGRIYRDLAPPTAAYPLLVLAGVAATDDTTANGVHVWSRVWFQVTVRDKGGTSKAAIKPLAEAVSAALDGLAVENGAIYAAKIRRTRVIPRPPDVVNTVVYPQIVIEFVCEAEPASPSGG